MSQEFNAQHIVKILNVSKNAVEALYKDIMANPETRRFVIETLKNVTTAIVAKKTMEMRSESISPPTASLSQSPPTTPYSYAPISSTTQVKEEVTINDHTWTGPQVRRILTRMIVAVILATGLATLFKNRDQIKTKVNSLVQSMDFDSVLLVLSRIINVVVEKLRTVKTKSASMFKSLLKKTSV